MALGESPARRLESARQKYPALGPPEILVWREFLRLHELEYDTLPASWLSYRATTRQAPPAPGDVFDYNVRIGQGRDPGSGFSQEVRDQWIEKTKSRIDAVGFKSGRPQVFEVDRFAGGREVGQLLSYLAIWRASKLTNIEPAGVMVTADMNQNAMSLIRETGIILVTVSVDFRVLSPFSTVPIAGTE